MDLTQVILALARQAQQSGALATAQTWTDIAQKTAATVAIVGTAGWAYFKFVRGRTFRRRVELTISGEVRQRPGIVYLSTNATVKNIGLSKFEIDHEKSGLRVTAHSSETLAGEARLAEWEPVSTWPVLEEQELLEPGADLLMNPATHGRRHAERIGAIAASAEVA